MTDEEYATCAREAPALHGMIIPFGFVREVLQLWLRRSVTAEETTAFLARYNGPGKPGERWCDVQGRTDA